MRIRWVLSLFGCVSGLVFGCGELSKTAGTNTNWLERCTNDDQCGVGSCLCGLCTKVCTLSSDDCGAIGGECRSGEVLGCDAPAPVCAAKTNDEPMPAGGSGSGGSGSGGASAGSGNAGGGNDACKAFDDDEAWSINVTLRNHTDRTLHIGKEMVSCATGPNSPVFTVEDESGTVLPDGWCRTPCEERGRIGGCPAMCFSPSTLTLEPGEGRNVTWDGLVFVERTLTTPCVAEEVGQSTLECTQARRIEPGRFVFRARAGTALECSDIDGVTGECLCTPIGTADCTFHGVVGGDILDAETAVDLDASYGVGQLEGMPSGDLVPVELVFEDD